MSGDKEDPKLPAAGLTSISDFIFRYFLFKSSAIVIAPEDKTMSKPNPIARIYNGSPARLEEINLETFRVLNTRKKQLEGTSSIGFNLIRLQYIKLRQLYELYAIFTPDALVNRSLGKLLIKDCTQDNFYAHRLPPRPLLTSTKLAMFFGMLRNILGAIVADFAVIPVVEVVRLVRGLVLFVTSKESRTKENVRRDITNPSFRIFRRVIFAPVDIILAIPISFYDVYRANQTPTLYKNMLQDVKKSKNLKVDDPKEVDKFFNACDAVKAALKNYNDAASKAFMNCSYNKTRPTLEQFQKMAEKLLALTKSSVVYNDVAMTAIDKALSAVKLGNTYVNQATDQYNEEITPKANAALAALARERADVLPPVAEQRQRPPPLVISRSNSSSQSWPGPPSSAPSPGPPSPAPSSPGPPTPGPPTPGPPRLSL